MALKKKLHQIRTTEERDSNRDKRHVFIVGSKGIPAAYGGFETFVEKLTEGRISDEIQYHVAVLSDHAGEYEYNNAHCFEVNVPDIGSAKAIYYGNRNTEELMRYQPEEAPVAVR